MDGDDCLPCDSMCLECSTSAEKCTKCEEPKSFLVLNKCYCNTELNWVEKDNTCQCASDYITQDNLCTDCKSLIPGCVDCQETKTNVNDAYIFLGPSPAERPDQDLYLMCEKCKRNTFYNKYSRQCTTCF
jgi:hypothetical protein